MVLQKCAHLDRSFFRFPSFSSAQVLQFLISHSDTIQAILRCQDVSAGSLQELALLTGIISKAALPGELIMLNGL